MSNQSLFPPSFFRVASRVVVAAAPLLFAMALGIALLPSAAHAEAHPHRGVLPKINGAPAITKLSKTDLATLGRGEAVRKQVKEKGAGRGIAVQDVAASPAIVWGRILDWKRYPKMVDNVKTVEVYEEKSGHIKTRFVVGGFGFSVEYFIDHTYKPEKDYMTWTLDYDKLSELDDSVGYWVVKKHPTKKGHSRVFYSVRVQTSSFIPGFIEDMIAENGLVTATEWVKRESEKVQKKKDAKARAAANP